MAAQRILELANAAGQALVIQLPAIQLPAPKPNLTARDIEKASDFMTTPEWRWLLPNCLKALKMATARCEFERSCLTPQQVLLHEEKVN